jgi:ribosomal protein S17E
MEYINHWQFFKKLKELAENCTKVKPSTAKRKATQFFEKYSDIIAYNSDYIKDITENLDKYKKLFEVAKSQKIDYIKDDGCKGVVLIKDVEQIESNNTSVILTTKHGRNIYLGKSFEYLIDLF